MITKNARAMLRVGPILHYSIYLITIEDEYIHIERSAPSLMDLLDIIHIQYPKCDVTCIEPLDLG